MVDLTLDKVYCSKPKPLNSLNGRAIKMGGGLGGSKGPAIKEKIFFLGLFKKIGGRK